MSVVAVDMVDSVSLVKCNVLDACSWCRVCAEWHWADLLSLPNLIVPFKRGLYIQIVSEFKLWPEKIREQYR